MARKVEIIDLTGSDDGDMEVVDLACSDTDSVIEIDTDPLYGNYTQKMQDSLVKKEKKKRFKAAPLSSPRIALLLAAHNIRVEKLILETRDEAIRKLPKFSFLIELGEGQIRALLGRFVAFINLKARQLQQVNAAFRDHDKVTGGPVFHVERMIKVLNSVSVNVRDFVVEQLGENVSLPRLKKVGNNPKDWNRQLLLASLQAHLQHEREKLKGLANSYYAVAREPAAAPAVNSGGYEVPVNPPCHHPANQEQPGQHVNIDATKQGGM